MPPFNLQKMKDVICIDSSDELPKQVSKTQQQAKQRQIQESKRKITDFQINQLEDNTQSKIISTKVIQQRGLESKIFLDMMSQKYQDLDKNLNNEISPQTFKKVKNNNNITTETIKTSFTRESKVKQFYSIGPGKAHVQQQSLMTQFFSVDSASISRQVSYPRQDLEEGEINGKEEIQYKRLKTEEFMQQMTINSFSIINDQQDRRVLAEYMYQKQYRSFDDYIQTCSEMGKSLLIDPYKFFNIERQFVPRSLKEKQVMIEKQLLLQLHEELEPKAIIQKHEKKFKRDQLLRKKQLEQQEARRIKNQNLEKQFKENQVKERRLQYRKAGIVFHRRQLRRELCYIEIKEEELPQKQNEQLVIVDQSILNIYFNSENLKNYKIQVYKMINQAYSEAHSNVSKKLEEKRREEQERRDKLRMEKKERRLLLKPTYLKIKDIYKFNYSDESGDSVAKIREDQEQQRLEQIEALNTFVISPPLETIPAQVEIDQPSDSFESSMEDSLCYKDSKNKISMDQYQNDFVIIQGDGGWLAIPNK